MRGISERLKIWKWKKWWSNRSRCIRDIFLPWKGRNAPIFPPAPSMDWRRWKNTALWKEGLSPRGEFSAAILSRAGALIPFRKKMFKKGSNKRIQKVKKESAAWKKNPQKNTKRYTDRLSVMTLTWQGRNIMRISGKIFHIAGESFRGKWNKEDVQLPCFWQNPQHLLSVPLPSSSVLSWTEFSMYWARSVFPT